MHPLVIYCFPFAGGSIYSFLHIKRLFEPEIDLRLLELPGHGNRFHEPLLYSVNEMIPDLTAQIMRNPESYCCFWGHSMGAQLAYLSAYHLQQQGMQAPGTIFVSGSSGVPVEKKQNAVYQMEPAEFWEEVIALGGVSPDIIADPFSKNYVEPILRADFKAMEDFYFIAPPVLDIPFIVINGTTDPVHNTRFNHRQVVHWEQLQSQTLRKYNIEGGHFFIYEDPLKLKTIFLQNILQKQ